jgi:hypothetical protein
MHEQDEILNREMFHSLLSEKLVEYGFKSVLVTISGKGRLFHVVIHQLNFDKPKLFEQQMLILVGVTIHQLCPHTIAESIRIYQTSTISSTSLILEIEEFQSF